MRCDAKREGCSLMSPACNNCCAPTRERLQILAQSESASAGRPRATAGKHDDMVLLKGGGFLMGSDEPESFEVDGESPVREVLVDPFWVSKFPVTNRQFRTFARATGYETEAEGIRWSFVFRNHVSGRANYPSDADIPWWLHVRGANWSRPEGPGSSIQLRLEHPVVHISWNDAQAYCEWAGVRLPTEAEWEFAARGGLEQKTYPWGDEFQPNGEHRCNIWQGEFPDVDLGEDGYSSTAPVDSYAPNPFGLFTMVGNTWEWCFDYFDAQWHQTATRTNPVGPPSGTRRVMKGGSYLCHASYCFRYRNAARTSNTPNTSTGHIGFRVVQDV